MEHFNKLTPAESERLALLAEECGEVIQAIGKVLRHGYESRDPIKLAHGEIAPSNRDTLTQELGDLSAAIDIMVEDVNPTALARARTLKHERVSRWMHHQASKPQRQESPT